MPCRSCNGKGTKQRRYSTHKVPCPCCGGRQYGCSCTRQGGSSCNYQWCRHHGGMVGSKETEWRTITCDVCGGSGGSGGSNNYSSSNNDDYYQQRRREEEERRQREESERQRQRAREAELQRQRDAERQRYEQQIREQQRRQEAERRQREEAERKAEEERLERERIRQEMEKNALLSELEGIYCKMSDVHIPNIQRLNGEIQSKYENEYLLNYKELKKENDRLNEYHMDILNDPTIQQLLLLGRTGDGKSTFGNRLCGDHSQYGDSGPFKIDHGTINSVTSKIERHTMRNKRISVIDTPGIFDTNNNDNFHLNEVIEHLRGANGINAFIMCCKIGRLDSKYQEMLQNLESMLTSMFWRNVIMVVTYCEDRYAQNWNTFKTDLWQTINRKLNLRANVFKPYQIIGVNNNDRNSYTLCINQLFNIVNDANKFNEKRFKSDKLISPIDKLKTNTLFIQNNIKSLISQRDNQQSEMTNCKQQLSQTINQCSAFHIDSKYANCVDIVDGIFNELANNNSCVLHDLTDIRYNNNESQTHSNNMNDTYQQQQLNEEQLNIIQSQFSRLEMAQQLSENDYKSNNNSHQSQRPNVHRDPSNPFSVGCPLQIKRVLGEGSYHPQERRQCGWCLQNKSNNTLELQCKLICIDDGGVQQYGLKVKTKPCYALCVRANRTCFVQIEVTAPRIADTYFAVYNLITNDGTIIADTLTVECEVTPH